MSSKQKQLNPKLVINPKSLSPADKETPCEYCTHRMGMLLFNSYDRDGANLLSSHYVCSLCFMYESPWGKLRASELNALISEIEEDSGAKMVRANDGKLLLPADADMVMAGIAITSEFLFAVQSGELSPDDLYKLMPHDEITPAKLSEQHGIITDPFHMSMNQPVRPAPGIIPGKDLKN
jgi:hypothetical protein